MSEKKYTARDVLTYLLSEAEHWKVDVDGDMDESGRPIDCTRHHIRIHERLLAELIDMAEITPRWNETSFEALTRANDEDCEVMFSS